MKERRDEQKFSEILTPPATFMESYNKGIPADFPCASIETMEQFQAQHPSLFKRSGEWSIDRHRKKLMDWLSSRREPRLTSAVL